MKLLEKANNMVVQANTRAQRAEDQVRILAERLEEAQRQTVPSDGPSSAIRAFVPLSRKKKKALSSDAMDVVMPLQVGSRKGKEREEAPYDGGDESEGNKEEEEEV